MTPSYDQERIYELEEELERLRETVNQLTVDLADSTGLNDQLERELASLKGTPPLTPTSP